MVLCIRCSHVFGAQRFKSVVCRFQTEESTAVMAPDTAQKVFSAKPGMLDIEFDCSSGFASPIRSYREEHNVRPPYLLT